MCSRAVQLLNSRTPGTTDFAAAPVYLAHRQKRSCPQANAPPRQDCTQGPLPIAPIRCVWRSYPKKRPGRARVLQEVGNGRGKRKFCQNGPSIIQINPRCFDVTPSPLDSDIVKIPGLGVSMGRCGCYKAKNPSWRPKCSTRQVKHLRKSLAEAAQRRCRPDNRGRAWLRMRARVLCRSNKDC